MTHCEFFSDSIPDDLHRRLLYAFGLSAAAIAGIGAAAASATASIVSLTKGTPKAPKAMAAPTDDKVAQASAEQRQRMMRASGYQSNILSDLSSTYGPGTGGLKVATGQ